MKKSRVMVHIAGVLAVLIVLLFLVTFLMGCEKKQLEETQVATTENSSGWKNGLETGQETGLTMEQEKERETEEETEQETELKAENGKKPPVSGAGTRIEEQSFEVELQPFGKVVFSSYAPDTEENIFADVVFLIEQDGTILTQLPGINAENTNNEVFSGVDAVSFLDYNKDGYDDVIAIVSYEFGAGPQAATPHPTIRYYTGSADGTFVYEEQMSFDATTALSEITIETAKSFIGVGTSAQ